MVFCIVQQLRGVASIITVLVIKCELEVEEGQLILGARCSKW